MKSFPVMMLCTACTLPVVAAAHDHDYWRQAPAPATHEYRGWHAAPPHRDWDDHARYAPAPYHYYGRYPYPVFRGYPYQYAYGYPYPYQHHSHHDNDDAENALWAIGGVAAGILIGTQIDNAAAPHP